MRQIQKVADSYTAIEFTTGTTARATDSMMGLPEAKGGTGGGGSSELDYMQANTVLSGHFEEVARPSALITPPEPAGTCGLVSECRHTPV